jgi:hypothetical protein
VIVSGVTGARNDQRLAAWIVASVCAAASPPLHAGEPLVTDDAAIVAPGTCQLEAWFHPTHDGHEYWAQPACNFTGNLELAIGLARSFAAGDPTSSLIHLQVKTARFSHDDNRWAFGVVGSADRDTGASRGRTAFQGFNVTGLASWYPRDDLEIDLNLGASYTHGSGSFAVAGAAVQYAPIDTLQLLGEIFRDEPGRPKFQIGTRGIVVQDRFELYASYGNRFDAKQWFATFGIRLQTAELIR